MKKKIFSLLLTAGLAVGLLAGCGSSKTGDTSASGSAGKTENSASAEGTSSGDLKEVTFVLDWTPNTNHTGVYVADQLGYFKDAGLKVKIVQPPDDGAETLVGSGKADFGVSFQDTMSSLMAGKKKSVPITAVAAVIQHNTSGIMSKKSTGIKSPKDMAGHSYATWDWDIEKAIIRNVVKADGGDYSKIKMIPETIDDEVSALKSGSIDCLWVYYAWAGISAKVQNFDINYFAFRDINPVFDYYSPVIIANDSFLKDHPDEAKAFLSAVSKGYTYAIKHPDKAADILCKAVPELNGDQVKASPEYLADQYQADASRWGEFDAKRWNRFYQWVNKNKFYDSSIPDNTGFTNEYLPEK